MDGLLQHVPESLVDRVRLIDLADEFRSPGINLLDTRIFSDRDRTADSVVRVARGLWDQWGPRMQSILEQTVKTLHEANERMDEDDQYTILDGLRLLSDEKFRSGVLEKVNDPYILEWWGRDFGGWRRETRADALAPVQTRLSYYASSKRARAILGQSRSTIDLRRTIHDGGILLVNTAQGVVGRDVAALVGASLLNLVDAVIREQGSLPPSKRRGALVVVDEMQSMPGVDYESMLSELGKFGASFILATQSLSKLEDLSRTMRDTLLANVGCLAVFQVAGSDARQLVWELGRDRVSEEDIVSLPVHQCYVRATVGTERMPAFSMKVRKPEPGDHRIASRILRETTAYTLSAGDIAKRDDRVRGLVEKYREGLGSPSEEGIPPGDAPRAPRGRRRRSKWDRPVEKAPETMVNDGERGGMRFDGVQGELMRLLAAMPFLDRLDMAAISGRSRGSVYESVRRLEDEGLVSSIPHGTEFTSLARRFYLTVAGLREMANDRHSTLDELLRVNPVSAQWMRILLERLDSVAVIYRLASTISTVASPITFRWYRAMPMDAVIKLPDGSTIAVVRQGPTSGRTSFSKRLWRLRGGPQTGAVLALMPDEVRLREARRRLSGMPSPAFLALERHMATADPDDAIWRSSNVRSTVDLVSALSGISPGGALPVERPLRRPMLPWDLASESRGRDKPDRMMPALLKPAEKRVLDLLHDWPWITQGDLAGVLGVSRPRVSQLLAALTAFGLVTPVRSAGRHLALTDEGLTILARRDRTAVGMSRKRWSVAPLDTQAPAAWRNVRGSRSRQLLRNLEHTQAVHRFIAALAKQARTRGWEVGQLDPPHRASRYFRHLNKLRSIHPDAFGVLCRGADTRPFFLEWERRAVRPATMAARLAPYLRYYSTHRPIDDHGIKPSVLIVFQDDIAVTHFLRVAREEMDRVGVEVPLSISHEAALEDLGPLGLAWRSLKRESRQTLARP